SVWPGGPRAALVLSHELEHGGAVALQLALPDAAYSLQGIGALRPSTRNFGESGVMEDDVGWHVLLGGAFAAPGAQRFKEGNVGHFHGQAIAAAPPAGTAIAIRVSARRHVADRNPPLAAVNCPDLVHL